MLKSAWIWRIPLAGAGVRAAVLLAMALTVSPAVIVGPALGQVERSSTPRNQRPLPRDAAVAARQRFLEMFARAYFPGRTGQLLIVPREGDIITRPDPNYVYMHGSPWPYDVSIPLMFIGPAVKRGVYSGAATQQDVAPTLAAALGLRMPPTATGRVLPVFQDHFANPRAVILIVADGMRRDYFERYAALMPTFSALRRRSAWFANAEVNVLPTNTAVGHSTIATGADPSMHGVTGISVYDFSNGRRLDMFAGAIPQ